MATKQRVDRISSPLLSIKYLFVSKLFTLKVKIDFHSVVVDNVVRDKNTKGDISMGVTKKQKQTRAHDTEVMVVEVPKRTPRRYRWTDERVVNIDMRGIRKPNTGNPARNDKRKFNSPQHLKTLCDEYFASCEGVLYNHKTGLPYIDRNGIPLTGQIKPYTVSGLALYLDMDTNILKRYEKGVRDDIGYDVDERNQYSTILKRARQRIESYAEGRLYDRDGSAGAKFVLDCAFSWVSKKEQAEIENMEEVRKQRQEEFKLKKELIDGDDDGNEINITITRKNKDE